MLESIHIKNYKLFEDLQVSNLARVNLISGRNNVGKTAFLEALRIYASKGHDFSISNILDERDDNERKGFKEKIASIFYNRNITKTIQLNNLKLKQNRAIKGIEFF